MTTVLKIKSLKENYLFETNSNVYRKSAFKNLLNVNCIEDMKEYSVIPTSFQYCYLYKHLSYASISFNQET